MKNIYKNILKSKANKQKLLAILLDPDKIDWDGMDSCIAKINASPATHIFIGGSIVTTNRIDELVVKIKENCLLPVILFPGNPSQISRHADGILFLTLISGRNPDYLIDQQVKAAPMLKETNIETISTGYMLIESGGETAVQKVSKTKPMDRNNLDLVLSTAIAGEMLGNKMIYLEAGSGAQMSVPFEMIKSVSTHIEIPLIVGGGIKNQIEIQNAFLAGADLVVIGNAFEQNINFFDTQIDF